MARKKSDLSPPSSGLRRRVWYTLTSSVLSRLALRPFYEPGNFKTFLDFLRGRDQSNKKRHGFFYLLTSQDLFLTSITSFSW